jgi:serine/threonine protein kinase
MQRRLLDHFDVDREPRVLGQGTHGPIIRARDVRTSELVAVKVFDAAEAFHSGRLPRAASLDEAHELTFRRFESEVRMLCHVHGGPDGRASDDAPGLGCSSAVVGLRGYSMGPASQPARAPDDCCYIVLELGFFTLEQLARESSQQGRKPSMPEVRDTLRSLLGILAEVHRSGAVLTDHAPGNFMRFKGGWKVIAVDTLLAEGQASLTADCGDPVYCAPELAELVLRGDRCGCAVLRCAALRCPALRCAGPIVLYAAGRRLLAQRDAAEGVPVTTFQRMIQRCDAGRFDDVTHPISMPSIGAHPCIEPVAQRPPGTRHEYLRRDAKCQSPAQQAARAGAGECGFDSRQGYVVR